MDLKKALAVSIAAAAALATFVIPAGAHGGPAPCVLLASAAQVNNFEFATTLEKAGDQMKGTAAGHSSQFRGEGNRFGLYYPVTDPVAAHWQQTGPNGTPQNGTGLIPATKGDHFNWKQTDKCANNSAIYDAKGTGIGYCGRSVGYGTGTVNPGAHSTLIRWESGGSQLILTEQSAFGSVNAQANPPGSTNGSCLNGGASVFYVDGVVVHN